MKPLNPFPLPTPATLLWFPHSAHRGTNSLLVPLETKIPSPKVIQKSLPRHYCKWKVANNQNLNSGGGGGEESHDECLDSFLFSELWPLSDTLGHVQGCQHLLKDGSFHVGSSQICFLQVTTWQITILKGEKKITVNWIETELFRTLTLQLEKSQQPPKLQFFCTHTYIYI